MSSELRNIDWPECNASFELHGQCPVQAVGEINGAELYFRARYSEWCFEIAGDDKILPSDGGKNGFVVESSFKDAGYMSLDEAEGLIEGCIKAYIRRRL